MYSLVSAIAKPINSKGRWIELDISQMLMPDIYSTYERVLATLSNPFLTVQVCLDLADIRSQYGGQSITFTAVLAANGQTTLPTTNTLPVLETRYVEFVDAFHAGYDVEPVNATASIGTDLPPSELRWLALTKAGVDYSLCQQELLVTVNGLIHPTTYDPSGFYVKDGMVSRNMCGEAQIGLASFRKLGKLTFIPITPDMVYKQDPNQVYKDRIHINLGQDVSQSTLMLVLGGYLHVLDQKTFYRVSDSSVAIVFNNLSYLDRFYESYGRIDLSSLGLDFSDMNPSEISLNQLYSDSAIQAYCCLEQSFFVLLDNTEIFKEKSLIQASKMPGKYISYTPPTYPLMSELGGMCPYWYSKEGQQFSISTTFAYRPQRMYWTGDPNAMLCVSDQLQPDNQVVNGLLTYLMIGSDVSLDGVLIT